MKETNTRETNLESLITLLKKEISPKDISEHFKTNEISEVRRNVRLAKIKNIIKQIKQCSINETVKFSGGNRKKKTRKIGSNKRTTNKKRKTSLAKKRKRRRSTKK